MACFHRIAQIGEATERMSAGKMTTK